MTSNIATISDAWETYFAAEESGDSHLTSMMSTDTVQQSQGDSAAGGSVDVIDVVAPQQVMALSANSARKQRTVQLANRDVLLVGASIRVFTRFEPQRLKDPTGRPTAKEGVVQLRAPDGQLHSFEVLFEGAERSVKVDLVPELQMESTGTLSRVGHWQTVHELGPTRASELFPGARVCPQCLYASSNERCPICLPQAPAPLRYGTRGASNQGRSGDKRPVGAYIAVRGLDDVATMSDGSPWPSWLPRCGSREELRVQIPKWLESNPGIKVEHLLTAVKSFHPNIVNILGTEPLFKFMKDDSYRPTRMHQSASEQQPYRPQSSAEALEAPTAANLEPIAAAIRAVLAASKTGTMKICHVRTQLNKMHLGMRIVLGTKSIMPQVHMVNIIDECIEGAVCDQDARAWLQGCTPPGLGRVFDPDTPGGTVTMVQLTYQVDPDARVWVRQE